MPPIRIPKSRDDVTPSWMRAALGGDVRRLPDLRAARLEDLGEGGSVLGEVLRCRLEWDGEAGDAPASVVVKLHSPNPRVRRFSKLLGLHKREHDFYRRVAPIAPIRSPRLLHGAHDPRTDDLVLVLEDLEDLEFADVLAGATPRQTTSALRAIARLHGRFWNRVDQPPLSECETVSTRLRALAQVGYVTALPAALDRFGACFSTRARQVAEAMAAGGFEYARRLRDGPQSYAHGDFHVNNVFFDPAKDAEAVVLDWQAGGTNNPLLDVGLFLSRSVSVEVRRRVERECLELYCDALGQAGVEDASLEECWRWYRASMPFSLMVMVLAAGQLGSGGRVSPEDFGRILRRVTTAVDDLDAHEFVPTGRRASIPARAAAALFGLGYRACRALRR